MLISSTSNTAVKRIRALRLRKEREDAGAFFVEGIRIVGEAVDSGAEIDAVVVAPDLLSSQYARDLVHRVAARGVRVLEVTHSVFRALSIKEGPQGIGAVVNQRWEELDDVVAGSELCWLALHEVADPGNLGTILRTADAVGAAGVILIGRSTDPYDPGALRASMGAIFSQRLVRATWDEFSAWHLGSGRTLIGTSDSAELDYIEAQYHPPLTLLMGSERQGLSPEQQTLCDVMVRIPMVGRSDSLNLAVATGVLLYEGFNRRRLN